LSQALAKSVEQGKSKKFLPEIIWKRGGYHLGRAPVFDARVLDGSISFLRWIRFLHVQLGARRPYLGEK
jgi:hypothetical protein